MNIKCLIFSTLILLIQSTSAQFLKQIVPSDSLFVESEAPSLSYFNYKVTKKQTLYHISRSFNVELDSLKRLNKEIQIIGLRENMVLKIPLNKMQVVFDWNKKQDSCIGLFYKIKSGESLYQLSKRKFDIDLKKIMQLNKLKNTDIREGTMLLLGFYKVNNSFSAAEIMEHKDPPPKVEEEIREIEKFTKQSRGVAICEYDQLGSGRLFALHNTAAMDSEIEIENPVLSRKVYAKVIGRIPPIYERDVQIIVSAEAARLLGAVDKRFFVSLKYR